MYWTYANCRNLTKAAYSDKISLLAYAYYNCPKLTEAIIGPNVNNCAYAFYGTKAKDAYVHTAITNINAKGLFGGRNNSFETLNIYARKDMENRLTRADSTSIVGQNVTWSYGNQAYYNTAHNIYMYFITTKQINLLNETKAYSNYVVPATSSFIEKDFRTSYV
jgi:hypothetical protein